jgi:sulfatase modifying factor 1
VIPCSATRRRLLALLLVALLGHGCRRAVKIAVEDAGAPSTPAVASEDAQPQVLYLPDGGDQVLGGFPSPASATPVLVPSAALNMGRRCPPEMVDIKGQFCIDRWEDILVDASTGRELSPYYSPLPERAKKAKAVWETERMNWGSAKARSLELPPVGSWQLTHSVEPMAVSKPGKVPNGYVDGNTAARVCERAGKRLCTTEEWTTACRGQLGRAFPYGEHYEHGVCNVFRSAHPAVLLHGDASQGHLDPRLNLVEGPDGPLLRATGSTPRCASAWGSDAVYDMVGNLDEWVEDDDGAFMGGFYARSTRAGCEARITAHPKPYADYSLGVRCCLVP